MRQALSGEGGKAGEKRIVVDGWMGFGGGVRGSMAYHLMREADGDELANGLGLRRAVLFVARQGRPPVSFGWWVDVCPVKACKHSNADCTHFPSPDSRIKSTTRTVRRV